MDFTISAPMAALLLTIPVLGIFSSYLARVSIGTRMQGPCQWLFLFLLAMVGCETAAATFMGAGAVPIFGIPFAVMILSAVMEFGRGNVATARGGL